MPLEIPEDAYGTRKRMEFIEAVIAARGPRTVLDVGCGVGNVSLSVAERFPEIAVTGIDSDPASIDHARRRAGAGNIRFLLDSGLDAGAKFDLVIASEVLEHVTRPEQFLRSLHARLNPDSCLIVTVPNGYGPFEVMSLVQGLMQLTGILALLRALRRRARNGNRMSAAPPDTLAASPHVNFFSRRGLNRLFARAGFTVSRFRPRTFLCGFVLDSLLRGRKIVAWNAAIADRLPASLCSDWMFLLEKTLPIANVAAWKNGLWGRLHRYLNRQCLMRGSKP